MPDRFKFIFGQGASSSEYRFSPYFSKRQRQNGLTIGNDWGRMKSTHFLSTRGFYRVIVGLWRSWERASMAWKRSSVRTRPGPPDFST